MQDQDQDSVPKEEGSQEVKPQEVKPQVVDAVKKEKQKIKYTDQYGATGRRKVATARVRLLTPGSGRIRINKTSFEGYFPRETHRLVIEQPLKAVQSTGKFDIQVNVKGGGKTGQAEATRHGIARALTQFDNAFRSVLKKAGFLTRDSRMKERKKYGRKRARKKFQYSKR